MTRIAVALFLALAWPGTAVAQTVVYHVVLRGELARDAARTVARAVAGAERGAGVAVLLEIDTEARDLGAMGALLDAVDAADAPVFALVRRDAADAGTMAALAADSIFLVPGASLHADTAAANFRALVPRSSALRRHLRALSPPATQPPSRASDPLRLSAEEAVRLGLAAGTVTGASELLEAVGLGDARVVPVDARWLGTTIVVENRGWGDLRIYVVRGGMRLRLGTVTSMNSATFDLTREQLAPGAVIQVLAEVIGSSDRIATERVRAEPGLVIEWAVENVLAQSSYFIWVRN